MFLALTFLRVLRIAAHDIILDQTPLAFGRRPLRRLPKKPWVSWLSRVDLQVIEDK